MKLKCVFKFNETSVQVISISSIENSESSGEILTGDNTSSSEIFTIELPENDNGNLEEINGFLPKHLDIPFNNLTSIILRNCKLTYLPFYSYFTNLLVVDISYNNFEEVPDWIINLKLKLETLNLSNNKITSFNVTPKCSKYLLNLDISNNRIEEMPFWLFGTSCPIIEALNISNNIFGKHLPFLTGRFLNKLRNLKMNNCKLQLDSVKFVHEIPNLRILSIGNITNLPHLNAICDLKFNMFNSISTITELNISGLGISNLSEDIYLLKSVEKLNLSHNCLTWLPENITKLNSLRNLDVSHNELAQLPKDIGTLQYLTEFYASDNYIGRLPDSISQLENLHILDCYNNELMVNDASILNTFENLTALDLEQNLFEAGNDENYINRRQKLRYRFPNRFNGSKEIVYNSFSDKSEKNSLSDTDLENLSDCSTEENWDSCDSPECTSDSSLILPPYRYVPIEKRKEKLPCDKIDPKFFEDSLDDR